MTKSIFSVMSIALASGFIYAGGDIKDVEPAVEPVIEVEQADESGFYLGLGLSGMKLTNEFTDEELSAAGITLQAGYQYSQYIAVEGRYSRSLGKVEYDSGTTSNMSTDDYPTDFTNVGIYLKPMYPVGDLKVYALLGYGEVEVTNVPVEGVDSAENGFQWGLGVSYSFNEDFSAFIDYLRVYDDTGFGCSSAEDDVVADIWTVGISYKF